MVVGRVVKGMEVVKVIEMVGSASGHTSREVVIADCGEVKENAVKRSDVVALA